MWTPAKKKKRRLRRLTKVVWPRYGPVRLQELLRLTEDVQIEEEKVLSILHPCAQKAVDSESARNWPQKGDNQENRLNTSNAVEVMYL